MTKTNMEKVKKEFKSIWENCASVDDTSQEDLVWSFIESKLTEAEERGRKEERARLACLNLMTEKNFKVALKNYKKEKRKTKYLSESREMSLEEAVNYLKKSIEQHHR